MIISGVYGLRAAEQVVELVVEPVPPADPVAALQASRAGGAQQPFRITLFHTGINSGPVAMTVDVLDSRPEPVLEGWEDVHEVSTTLPAGRVAAGGPMEELTALGEIGTDEAGDYRIRVSAVGRDAAPDLVSSTAVEEYLVQMWPETVSPPRVLSATSEQGQYWASRLG
ncbi:hypothetical protein NtRootA4_25650 [Arthrobacter sp. NtRootA4]|nr:hypothetical protein NtRootA2_27830 [Arthrobacter sp. NtRootA2]BCW15586.1 hypothetical protein NtRootA4_25650 [Arthrobacter sp. NtRootA4]BCW23920.1 hypothetical protein NtRootC7_27870 [Arthrobacter sp. NtRootC7]BCW28188.1 hypothetical protein NtRootC45_27880 [Arthrobacter sp. NtRootC45]BCW32458.1 hypothetical protein NtRootD5_27890 [Arthrobacter sp. NtRootD5]